MKNEIIELKRQLEYHDDLYYNQDNPKISDAEYDALKSKYLDLIKKEEYDYVPGEAKFEPFNHEKPILSLAKVNNLDDLRKEIERLWPVVIEPKFDGLTLVLYPNTVERREAIVTRGNGIIGENVIDTAIKIDGINQISISLPFRMEAYIEKSTLDELNAKRISDEQEPFKNCRNAVAGMLRNKDASKVSGVKYFAYNLIGSSWSETKQLEYLKANNVRITDYYVPTSVDDAIDFVKTFDRDALDYDIDGLVIKSNLPNSLQVFGETGHHPKNAVAFKFPPPECWTKLNDVIWQAGRTGKITPVAILEPVELAGSIISRATLHNQSIIDSLGLMIGQDVQLIKANDVIPAIIGTRLNSQSVSRVIKEPTHCPVCEFKLDKINDQLFCQNPTCGAKIFECIVHLGGREAFDIEGLGPETVAKIIDAGLILHPFDIFSITKEELLKLEGFAEKSADNLYKAIQKAKTSSSLDRFIYAAGVPNIGRTASKEIASLFGDVESFLSDLNNECEKTKTIDGFGPTMIKSLLENKELFFILYTQVKPLAVETKKKAENALIFVITGTLEQPRSYYENLIRNAGHKVSGSVSKKTDYVLVGKDAGSKLEKAKALEIKIITTERELLELL